METLLQHAQGLVYALLHLMPSPYQHASLSSLLGLFLEAQGHPLPQHCQTKSASALSRFLNHYEWSTRSVLRTTRHQVLQQIGRHLPSSGSSLKVLIDLTTLEYRNRAGGYPSAGTECRSKDRSPRLTASRHRLEPAARPLVLP